MTNQEKKKQIVHLLKRYPQAEVARRIGSSRQWTHQVSKELGIDGPKGKGYRWDKIDPYLGTMSDREVAEKFNVVPITITKRRVLKGVSAHQNNIKSHCWRCKAKPYAKGFCKTCYTRDLRRKKV